MTKRSHSIYFDRMINFSLLIQNGDVWGELGKYLILSNIDYLEKSFCINPNTLSCLCFEIAQSKLSNFLWRLFTVSAVSGLFISKSEDKSLALSDGLTYVAHVFMPAGSLSSSRTYGPADGMDSVP